MCIREKNVFATGDLYLYHVCAGKMNHNMLYFYIEAQHNMW